MYSFLGVLSEQSTVDGEPIIGTGAGVKIGMSVGNGVGIGVGLVVGLCVNIVVGAGTGGLVRWLPPSSDDDRLIDIISALCRRRSASISPLAILDAFSQMFPISSFDCKDRSNVESNGGSLFRTLEYDFSLSKSSTPSLASTTGNRIALLMQVQNLIFLSLFIFFWC